MKLAENLLAPTIAGHEKAALRQENVAANEQKAHARQIGKLQGEFSKPASKLNVETFDPRIYIENCDPLSFAQCTLRRGSGLLQTDVVRVQGGP